MSYRYELALGSMAFLKSMRLKKQRVALRVRGPVGTQSHTHWRCCHDTVLYCTVVYYVDFHGSTLRLQ